MEEPLKFLVDDTMRGLSKKLRMIGYDTVNRDTASWWVAFARAKSERRIVITLLKTLRQPPDVIIWVLETQNSNEQIQEVLSNIPDESPAPTPFSRCLVCNRLIRQIPADDARKAVPPLVSKQHSTFRQCPDCNRIYWPGSHYHKMRAWMKKWDIYDKLGLPQEGS